MARHSRKVHRKSHRKSHRKAHRKSHRRSHRHRRQHGGASCAAQPLFNRSLFGQQGGMAPIMGGDARLIDAQSSIQAQTASLDSAFAELSSVIPRQAGGRRRRTARRRSHKHHKGSRKAHRRSHRHRRQQGGALAEFSAPYDLGVDIMKTNPNPQFLEYLPAKGAQAL